MWFVFLDWDCACLVHASETFNQNYTTIFGTLMNQILSDYFKLPRTKYGNSTRATRLNDAPNMADQFSPKNSERRCLP